MHKITVVLILITRAGQFVTIERELAPGEISSKLACKMLEWATGLLANQWVLLTQVGFFDAPPTVLYSVILPEIVFLKEEGLVWEDFDSTIDDRTRLFLAASCKHIGLL